MLRVYCASSSLCSSILPVLDRVCAPESWSDWMPAAAANPAAESAPTPVEELPTHFPDERGDAFAMEKPDAMIVDALDPEQKSALREVVVYWEQKLDT